LFSTAEAIGQHTHSIKIIIEGVEREIYSAAMLYMVDEKGDNKGDNEEEVTENVK
jgi:hypothetical protein